MKASKNDLPILHPYFGFVACCGFVALALAAGAVDAQPVGAYAERQAFERFVAVSTGSGGQTLKFGGSGTPLPTSRGISGAPVGAISAFADTASKGLIVSGYASVPVGTAGRAAAVAVEGKVAGSALAKAASVLSTLAGGPAGMVILAGTLVIPALMDWYDRSGVSLADGTFRKSDPSVCTTAPCSEYASINFTTGGPDWSSPSSSAALACVKIAAAGSAWSANYNMVYRNNTETNCNVSMFPKAGGSAIAYVDYNIGSREGAASAVSYIPASQSDVEAALAATQPAPEVLKELYTIDQTGRYSDRVLRDLAITNVVASGPSSVAGPSSTEVTPAQNGQPAKSVTTASNYNCVYVMADVTCNEVKTATTAVTSIDGQGNPTTVTTATTTTAEPAKPPEPVDPCDANPSRVGCLKIDVPTDEVPKKTVTITWAEENLGFGAGSCPAPFTFTTLLGTHSLNLAQYCDAITAYVRPLVIAFSLLAAFFIIAPVKENAA
jgi:hypothetical protein